MLQWDQSHSSCLFQIFNIIFRWVFTGVTFAALKALNLDTYIYKYIFKGISHINIVVAYLTLMDRLWPVRPSYTYNMLYCIHLLHTISSVDFL